VVDMAVARAERQGAIEAWIGRKRGESERGRRSGCGSEGEAPVGVRFAFYGRTSTADFQDRGTSRGWQREAAETVIAGRGVIVADFFDVGCSRRLPWTERPRAAALLAAITGPQRPFDAIVVGEYERAFAGDQFEQMVPLLERCGVWVWLPESGGPVDLGDPMHRALIVMLGAQSQREVLRSRHRVLAAMRTQACEQGRYLGGRPPYGYRLVDAGPHPNRAHARWGRRLQRLEPDPVTAPHVRWIFTERLAGRSMAGIARELNERGVPCPSAADQKRNPHRSGQGWTLQTVAAILGNPRYTGRQVWDRQRTEHEGQLGSEEAVSVRRRHPVWEWAVSKQVAHAPLVSEEEFVAAQAIRAARPNQDGNAREYLFSGLLRCRMCLRRMDAHWVNDRPGYRCRHGYSSAKTWAPARAKNLYVREDRMLAAHLPGRDPSELAQLLRSNDLMIVCDTATWTIAEADSDGPAETDLFEQLKPGPHPFMG
jgi:site-specific DNA recombinase